VRSPSGKSRASRRGLVGDGPEVHHGLDGIDEARKGFCNGPAVDVLDLHGPTCHVDDGVEHHEAGAVRLEVGVGGSLRLEVDAALCRAPDLRRVVKGAGSVARNGPIGDGEAVDSSSTARSVMVGLKVPQSRSRTMNDTARIISTPPKRIGADCRPRAPPKASGVSATSACFRNVAAKKS